RYLLVADQNPDRLEGDEARLKIGICLAEQDKPEEARKVFASVRGGPLEPFAMGEEAMLHFRRGSRDPEPGLRILQDMVERFPESQAQAHVLEAANRARRPNWDIIFAGDFETDVRLRAETMELAASAAQGALKSNLVCAASLMSYRFLLGEWRRALEQGLEYWTRITPEKRRMPTLHPAIWSAAMAAGMEDRVPDEPIPPEAFTHNYGTPTPWATDFRLHWAARGGGPAAYLADVFERYGGEEAALGRGVGNIEVVQAMLAAGRVDELAAALERALESPDTGSLSLRRLSWNVYSWAVPVFEAGREDLREAGDRFLEIWMGRHDDPALREDLERVRRTGRARAALAEGDLAAAAAALENEKPPHFFFGFGDDLVLQAMLSSLGELKSPARGELERSVETHLAGPARELARGFLRGELPEMTGDLWPVPTFIPEWRFWAALWLERRGERERALNLARPALDARYGLANCQVPLGKLTARLEK
ncbi:MAG: tetratricopeptide repeat protein, partial [Planctomycetota bacterium]